MSNEGKAVFLSYASEDVEAARRICHALRDAGIEVWFDQSELRGGDAWDQKIRRQIKECALFVPIISANTQTRAEGYFRLEWKLAVDRSHQMADDETFILPVVIDDTPNAAARVPDKFRERQWVQIGSADSLGAFCERVGEMVAIPMRGGTSSRESVKTVSLHVPSVSGELGPPKGKRNGMWVTGGAVAVVMAIIGFVAFRPTAPKPVNPDPAGGGQARTPAAKPPTDFAGAKSVAVLAFADLSAEKDGEYFSDGISEELLNVLAKVPGLRVAARTSAFYFKGRNTPIPDIAKQLNVGYVVEGSVRKAGSRVRITAQLINAADGFHVWSDNFDRELKDIFAVQDEIAGLIAQKLQLTLGAGTRVTKVVDPEAYKLYLEARQYAITLSVDNWSRGEKLYSQALDIDRHFTRAAAGLVLLRATRVGNECVALRFHEQQLAEIEREARELLLRDPGLGEAHAALGGVYTSRDDVAAAEAEYQHADRLGFSPEQSANVRPFLHFRRGRPDLAIAAMEEARRNNPLAWVPVDVHGLGLLFCGRYAEAAEALGRATRIGSAPSAFANYALALVGLGRNDEAIAAARAALEVANRTDRQDGFLAVSDGNAAWALARAGVRAEAEAVARRLQAGPVASRYTAGLAIAELGRLDEALVLLDDLVPSPMLGFLFFFLNDRPALSADPRVTALLRKHRAVEEFETFRRVVAEQQSARATRNP